MSQRIWCTLNNQKASDRFVYLCVRESGRGYPHWRPKPIALEMASFNLFSNLALDPYLGSSSTLKHVCDVGSLLSSQEQTANKCPQHWILCPHHKVWKSGSGHNWKHKITSQYLHHSAGLQSADCLNHQLVPCHFRSWRITMTSSPPMSFL